MEETKKYSNAFKLQAVNMYLSGEHGGYKLISKKLCIPSSASLRRWVDNYKKYGKEYFSDLSYIKKSAKNDFNLNSYSNKDPYFDSNLDKEYPGYARLTPAEKLQFWEAKYDFEKELSKHTSSSIKKK